MRRRFSLKGLLGAVLLLGLGLAALSRPSPGGAALLRVATAAALLIAPLGAIYRRGPDRAGWVGFALLGWGAVALSADARPDSPVGLANLAAPIVRSMPARWIHARGVGDPVEVLRTNRAEEAPRGRSVQPNDPPTPPFMATIVAVTNGRYRIRYGGPTGTGWVGWYESEQLHADDGPDLERIVGSLLVLLFAAGGSAAGRLLFSTRGMSDARPTASGPMPA